MRRTILLVISIVLVSCGSKLYRDTPDGEFHGHLDVRWLSNDKFRFVPNPDNPFRFDRANGSSVIPREMETDGGSIPRFLWGMKGLSPWGYAPAYILHDWIFLKHQCGLSDTRILTAEESKAALERHELLIKADQDASRAAYEASGLSDDDYVKLLVRLEAGEQLNESEELAKATFMRVKKEALAASAAFNNEVMAVDQPAHTFEDSVNFMAEGLKAVMKKDRNVKNYFLFNAVVTGVNTPIARRIWDAECELEGRLRWVKPEEPGERPPGERPPESVLIMTFHFD